MSENQESRIVVDEEWKARVAAEKANARKQARKEAESAGDFPPASFELLVMQYSTQAMMSMGVMPDPLSGKTERNIPLARHLIDMLDVVQKISRGNLSPDQESGLTDTIHQLRMAFISARAQSDTRPADGAKEEEKKSKLEIPEQGAR